MNDTRKMVERYIGQGWQPIPLPVKSKAPQRPNWQRGGFTVDDFDPGGNIGLLLGEISDGLVDVDLDCEEAIEAAPDFLPATGWRFGRDSRPNSHWIYRVTDASKTTKWQDEDGCMLELRATGAQTMAPPSVHPSGERVRDDLSGEPTEVSRDELHDACTALAGWARTRRFFNRTPLYTFLIDPERSSDADERYVQSALDGEVEKVRNAAEGTRNDTLNRAALKLGHYVGSDLLDDTEVVDALADAACACGLPEQEAVATIRSGLTAGIAEPKAPPERADWRAIPRPERGARPILTFAEDLECRAPDWLIPKLLEKDSLAAIFGAPGSGKSFVAIDLACRLASGTPWRGHQVEPGPVVYVAGEGHAGIARRVAGWQIHNGDLPRRSLAFAPSFDVADPVSYAETAQAIAVGMEEPPKLIILDTLARCLHGDENSSQDMSVFVSACDKLRADFNGATVLLVHHTGHAAGERARGSSVLPAALDAAYRVEIDATRRFVTCTTTKLKDGEIGEPLVAELQQVDLPGMFDADGGPVTTAVIEADESADLSAILQKSAPTGGGRWQAVGRQIAEQLAGDGGVIDTIDKAEWLAEAERHGMPKTTRYRVWRKLQNLARSVVPVPGVPSSPP